METWHIRIRPETTQFKIMIILQKYSKALPTMNMSMNYKMDIIFETVA